MGRAGAAGDHGGRGGKPGPNREASSFPRIGTYASNILSASLFGLSPNEALVVLFVLLPIALAAVLVPLMVWRSSRGPRPILTSEILATGLPGEAEILSVRPLGSFLEVHPMVRFVLRVVDGADSGPFELEVVQSLPRVVVGTFRPGDRVEVRFTPDHAAGAVVWGGWPTVT